MTEQWIRWEPIVNFRGKHNIKSLLVAAENLFIELYSSKSNNHFQVELIFRMCDAYRQTTEGFRLGLFHELSRNYPQGFYGDWTFFKVLHSNYLSWLMHNSSITLAQTNHYTHFCLLGDDFVVDIISSEEPIVKLFDIAHNQVINKEV